MPGFCHASPAGRGSRQPHVPAPILPNPWPHSPTSTATAVSLRPRTSWCHADTGLPVASVCDRHVARASSGLCSLSSGHFCSPVNTPASRSTPPVASRTVPTVPRCVSVRHQSWGASQGRRRAARITRLGRLEKRFLPDGDLQRALQGGTVAAAPRQPRAWPPKSEHRNHGDTSVYARHPEFWLLTPTLPVCVRLRLPSR